METVIGNLVLLQSMSGTRERKKDDQVGNTLLVIANCSNLDRTTESYVIIAHNLHIIKANLIVLKKNTGKTTQNDRSDHKIHLT